MMKDQPDSHRGKPAFLASADSALNRTDAMLRVMEDPVPAKASFYSQQEIAFSDAMHTIVQALRTVYDTGISRKQLRRESGLNKKAFRQVEELDPDARLGDMLSVLAAAHKTLAVVDLPDRTDTPADRPEKQHA